MAKSNGYRLSQAEYAARRGITQPRVAKLIKQGKLDGAYKKAGRKYLINPDKADKLLAAALDPARAQAPPDAQLPTVAGLGPASSLTGELISFAEAARREKVARAALLELELSRERGELIERGRVEAVAAKIAGVVRVGVEAIPAKVAPVLAGMVTPGDVARYLQRELKTVLMDMAKQIEKMDF
jgi:hypothetical protein